MLNSFLKMMKTVECLVVHLDYTKVVTNGTKVTKQKYFVLTNHNELYVAFKNYQECKIGNPDFVNFTSIAIFWLLEGTHSVCVCSYNQNVKLTIDCAKLNVNYKELLDILVCGSNNYDYMMSLCEKSW